MNAIALQVQAQRHSYVVRFYGPNAEGLALQFCKDRMPGGRRCPGEFGADFAEVEGEPIDSRYRELLGFLHPLCPHGLSADSCYGPQHYYYDAEEQAHGLLNGW